MNEKNMTSKKNKAALPEEDIQLYRLFCIFGVAILGFAGFRLPYATLFGFLRWGQWLTLGLLVLVIGAYVFIHFVKKVDESKNIVTSTGVAYFLIPVLYLLTTFRSMEDPMIKCQVAFGFVALFAAIYNIFKKEFRLISAVTFLSLVALYYASHTTYDTYENILAIASKGLIFLIPALVIAALVIPQNSKRAASLVKDKFGKILTIVMCAVLLVCALLVLIVPSVFLYVMIAILAVYVVVGIVCTIRLI